MDIVAELLRNPNSDLQPPVLTVEERVASKLSSITESEGVNFDAEESAHIKSVIERADRDPFGDGPDQFLDVEELASVGLQVNEPLNPTAAIPAAGAPPTTDAPIPAAKAATAPAGTPPTEDVPPSVVDATDGLKQGEGPLAFVNTLRKVHVAKAAAAKPTPEAAPEPGAPPVPATPDGSVNPVAAAIALRKIHRGGTKKSA